MQFLIFAIVYPLIWIMSRLPMRILYVFSDFFFFILYNFIGYRKNVVESNLKTAFPEKSDTEIKKMSKKFFRHFVDLVFESIKSFSISEKQILKRYTYKNPEVVNDLAKQGRSIALVGAHLANWEWSFSTPLVLDIPVFGAYTKLGNKYFEKAVKASRSKFGVTGFKTTETVKGIHKNHEENIQGLYILLSDQSPEVKRTHYWANFFNVRVPIHTGAEMLAKRYDFAVVNYAVRKIKRGYFEVEFELITDSPRDYKDYEITDKYLEITQKNIRKQPEFYLWTHKRFKHKDLYDEWLEKRKASQK